MRDRIAAKKAYSTDPGWSIDEEIARVVDAKKLVDQAHALLGRTLYSSGKDEYERAGELAATLRTYEAELRELKAEITVEQPGPESEQAETMMEVDPDEILADLVVETEPDPLADLLTSITTGRRRHFTTGKER